VRARLWVVVRVSCMLAATGLAFCVPVGAVGTSGHPVALVRPRAAIEQAVAALVSVPAQPLVGGRPADALRLGGGRPRPTLLLDPADEKLSPKHVELGHTMGHESLLHGLVLNTPNRGARLSLVNNVCGNHT
jgi:hypothetical protein